MNKRMRLACLVSLLSLAVSASPLIAQDKLRVGLSSVSGLHAAVWVAETRGLFRKHGIDAEVIVTGQGGTAGISALIANDVQMVNSAGDVLVAASLRGGDTVMMLQRWKMNPNDVQVMQLGSSPNMLASLDKGGIEGAVLTIPSMFVAEDRGYRVLLDMADTDIYYLHTMVATTRHYVKTNRDKVLRFLKGYVEGIAFVKQNRKESLEIVQKKLRIGPEQERNLERSLDLMSTKYYEQVPYPSLRGVETVMGFIEKDNPKAKGADPKSFVDDSLLREIEASGFVKGLYQR